MNDQGPIALFEGDVSVPSASNNHFVNSPTVRFDSGQELRLTVSNIIKVGCEGRNDRRPRDSEGNTEGTYPKKRQQKQTEVAPSKKGYRKGQ